MSQQVALHQATCSPFKENRKLGLLSVHRAPSRALPSPCCPILSGRESPVSMSALKIVAMLDAIHGNSGRRAPPSAWRVLSEAESIAQNKFTIILTAERGSCPNVCSGLPDLDACL